MESLDANKPVIPILTGPTGGGKTGVAVRLLELYPDMHIISADSRQIYKHLNIGTDKPPRELLSKYNFHLVDIIEPGERYTAFDFVVDTKSIIDKLLTAGKLPLICGGTGLYIKSLVDGIAEIPEDDFSIRDSFEQEAADKGPKYLYGKLKEIDPLEAQKTHPHNLKRIIRALEIFEMTGKTKSELIASDNKRENRSNYEIVCLLPPREELYEKINNRVDLMISSGLLREAENLRKSGLKEKVEKINVIGYNELFRHLDGELSLEAAVNLTKQNSRRFAKRQISWFKGMEKIKYLDSAELSFEHLVNFRAERGKINA